jgi:uncharacterized membrane protein
MMIYFSKNDIELLISVMMFLIVIILLLDYFFKKSWKNELISKNKVEKSVAENFLSTFVQPEVSSFSHSHKSSEVYVEKWNKLLNYPFNNFEKQQKNHRISKQQ